MFLFLQENYHGILHEKRSKTIWKILKWRQSKKSSPRMEECRRTVGTKRANKRRKRYKTQTKCYQLGSASNSVYLPFSPNWILEFLNELFLDCKRCSETNRRWKTAEIDWVPRALLIICILCKGLNCRKLYRNERATGYRCFHNTWFHWRQLSWTEYWWNRSRSDI